MQIKQEETLSEVDEKYHHCTHGAATSISHDLGVEVTIVTFPLDENLQNTSLASTVGPRIDERLVLSNLDYARQLAQ